MTDASTRQFEDWARCKKCGWEWPIGAGDDDAYANKRGSRRDITRPASVTCPLCQSSDWTPFKDEL